MHHAVATPPMTRRVVDALYLEAMLVADEARSYFDENGRDDRDGLDPMARVLFSCESLKVTTRLMNAIAWLLGQKAIIAGEAGSGAHLGKAASTDPRSVANLPEQARQLIAASTDLYDRIDRIARGAQADDDGGSPARAMLNRLEKALG